MKKLLTLTIVVALLGFTGCANPKGIKTAAYVGTTFALAEHPEWRLGFEQAYQSLGVLEQAETIGLAEVLAILNRLPVKELQSKEARIIITSTVLLIEDFGSLEINPVTTEKLRPTIKKLREGIKLALDTNFSAYAPDGTLKTDGERSLSRIVHTDWMR